MINIPTLTTDRLILRAPTLEDFDAYCAMMMSERSGYMGGPYSREDAWKWFCHDVAQWPLFGHGSLMIELKDTRQVVGQTSINSGPLFPEQELGWFLYEGFEGQGYALEAARALRDWAFSELGLTTLVSYVDPANHSSKRLAERLGAVQDSEAIGMHAEDFVMRHPRPDDA